MALCSLRLSESPDGRRIAEFPEFRIYLRSAEEVYILAEILVEGVYNFMVPEPCAVLDIGMNVGIASLFFATRAGAAYVVGYEPFARTYACLQENLGLNPHLNGRIKAVQAGVAGANGSVEAEYSHDMQGSSGPVGFTKPFAPGAQVSRERLDVRGAREVADDFLREAAPKASVFALKIDCEGAEYEIVPALGSSGRLASFKAVMIEWHGRGPQPLVDVLRRASFSVFSFTSLGPRTGMIYAIR